MTRPTCIKDRCWSPVACEGWGYCRELNMNSARQSPGYDWNMDAYGSWLLAIASIREGLIAAGKIARRDDADDRAWMEKMRSRDIPGK